MNRQPRKARRRGTLYLSVLGTAMLASIAGLAAMHVARTELRAAVADRETTASRAAAEAGVEFALEQAGRLADWRTRFTARELQPEVALGDARFSYLFDAGLDDDGDTVALDAARVDEITVRGFGYAGGSVSIAEATLVATAPLESLEASIAVQGDLSVQNGNRRLTVSRPAFSGADIDTGVTSAIVGEAIAVGAFTGTATSVTQGAPPREFPDPATVFDYYLARGTRIAVGDLPSLLGVRRIDKAVLSPASNPFGGGTNPEGIYVIDCEGAAVTILDSRIVGTLVLLNNSSISSVRSSIHWEPAVANYPALMVENGLLLMHSTSDLDERDEGVSYNPPGTPYLGGEDNDQDDSYPSGVTGLIYAGGKITAVGSGGAVVNGLIVCNEADISTSLTINSDGVQFNHPPPGFRTSRPDDAMAIETGSWRRGAN